MAARAKVNLMQPEIILFMKENRKDTSDKLFVQVLQMEKDITDVANQSVPWTVFDFPLPK